ncbi:hypothetical protein [Aestuariivirga sp.]|uniref:hypothetical protein n=1 Tax=Aestuariivirga sp. TaxID=2650926 RepID=UPI00359431D6
MRKLSPPKAISHALNSVLTYRREAMRIGMFWIPVLIVLGLGKILVGAPDPEATEFDGPMLVEIVSTAIAFVAFSSIAVSWHRFILRDEAGVPWRLDGSVLRYAGNSLLIVLMVGIPVVLMLLVTVLVPQLWFILLPLSLLCGTLITALSVKLPAVALGRTDFSFAMAWQATKGSFWPLLGVFLLNAAIIIGMYLLTLLAVSLIGTVNMMAGQFALLIADAGMALFVALFNASVFTSLYGFFVESRDF